MKFLPIPELDDIKNEMSSFYRFEIFLKSNTFIEARVTAVFRLPHATIKAFGW